MRGKSTPWAAFLLLTIVAVTTLTFARKGPRAGATLRSNREQRTKHGLDGPEYFSV